MLYVVRVSFVVMLVLRGTLVADWLDQIGYRALAERLGESLPVGRGIGLTQVEAPSGGGGHLPESGDGRFTGTAAFVGKQFHAHSGRSTVSDHARIVAHYLYASSPLESFGAVSLSPAVNTIDLFRAGVGDYLSSDFLEPAGQSSPIREVNAIQNHSWYGQMGTASVGYMNEKLRRVDYSVSQDDYLCVVAMANGVDSPIPPLLASAYNVLVVGCSHGDHSHGHTHKNLDGGARTRVDLVAPLSATSYATPVVSSAAAILLECIESDESLAVAKHNEVMRAILMVGACKDPFPTWNRSDSQPFDPHFGAGELRVDRSHAVLTAGQWRYGETRGETFEQIVKLTATQQDLSVVLSWNRLQTLKNGRTSSGTVADMSLRLARINQATGERTTVQVSDSPNENREHLYLPGIESGEYAITVESDESVRFGLAWNAEPVQSPQVEVSHAGIRVSGLLRGRTYQMETSMNLVDWEPSEVFVPQEDERTVPFSYSLQGRGYYRVSW